MLVHNAKMHADMIHQLLEPHTFNFENTFDETNDNSDVYKKVFPVVLSAIQNLSISTVMCYGQTGSGKVMTI